MGENTLSAPKNYNHKCNFFEIIFKNSTNNEKLEYIEYIFDNIIHVIEFEKIHIYFKTRVVSGIFGWIFLMFYDIDIHELNLGSFTYLKFLD